jgi:hypothetical protein
MRLFDGGVRTDPQYATYSEPHFRYLNRSARLEADRIRAVLDQWFERYPKHGQLALRAAFRSDDDWQHDGAFFELFLHELLVRLGCEIELHPNVPRTSKRPDFSVKPRREAPFYLEATVATGESAESRTRRARANTVYDGLNKLESPNFFLSVQTDQASNVQPSGRKMRQQLAQWLEGLDPDVVAAQQHAGAGPKICQHSITTTPAGVFTSERSRRLRRVAPRWVFAPLVCFRHPLANGSTRAARSVT